MTQKLSSFGLIVIKNGNFLLPLPLKPYDLNDLSNILLDFIVIFTKYVNFNSYLIYCFPPQNGVRVSMHFTTAFLYAVVFMIKSIMKTVKERRRNDKFIFLLINLFKLI